jgi:hypothetical protein
MRFEELDDFIKLGKKVGAFTSEQEFEVRNLFRGGNKGLIYLIPYLFKEIEKLKSR